MKIFEDFTKELDSTGEKLSSRLSEVDLSDPEDVRALILDQGSDVLVHFGDSQYLDRFRKYEAHLPEWRQQYPKLSSVDMRYERQVVLQMQPGTPLPLTGATPDPSQKDGSQVAHNAVRKTGIAVALNGRPRGLLASKSGTQGSLRAKGKGWAPMNSEAGTI